MAEGVALNKKVGGEMKYEVCRFQATSMGIAGIMIINEHDMVERN